MAEVAVAVGVEGVGPVEPEAEDPAGEPPKLKKAEPSTRARPGKLIDI
jgi:hypothetical protein